MCAERLIAAKIAACILVLSPLPQARAQTRASLLDDAGRSAVIDTAAKALRDRYVYPAVGERAAAAIEAELRAGSYDEITDPEAFARRLTTDVQKIAHDKHLYVTAPSIGEARRGAGQSAPPPQPLSEGGVIRADRLAGNIGYLELFAFSPLDMFKPPVGHAMGALAGERALIIDVRQNVGGDPASVDDLLSYFLGTVPVEIGRSVSRTPGMRTFTTQEYWINTKPAVSFVGKPVFVLTSAGTFSGGEAFAYDMQKLRLGTLVGETTAGAANVTSSVPLARGFEISVPYARGSGATWEGAGVKPDIVAPSANALKVALQRLGLKPASGDIGALSQARVFTPRSTPTRGGEAAIRQMIAEIRRDDPRYDRMNEVMAKALRERLPTLHKMLTSLGAIKSIRFAEINWMYGDIYSVKFANGSVYWAIALDPRGKIVMWEVRPVGQIVPRESRREIVRKDLRNQ